MQCCSTAWRAEVITLKPGYAAACRAAVGSWHWHLAWSAKRRCRCMARTAKVMTLKPGLRLLRWLQGCRSPTCGGASPKLGLIAEGPAKRHAGVRGATDQVMTLKPGSLLLRKCGGPQKSGSHREASAIESHGTQCTVTSSCSMLGTSWDWPWSRTLMVQASPPRRTSTLISGVFGGPKRA